MNNFTELNNYTNTKSKMLYTFCFYKITVADIQVYLSGLLDKISSMKEPFKRKIANDRVYGLKSYFDTQDINLAVNAIYLVDVANKPIGFSLDKSHIQVLTEFKIPTTQFFCDEYYQIKYLQKLVSTTELVNVVLIDGTNGKQIQIDSVKNKHFDQTNNLDNLISRINPELIFGTPSSIQNLQKKYPNKQFYAGKLSNEQVWNQVVAISNGKTQAKFNADVLSQLDNLEKIGLFVFGRKNVREEILVYSIKQLFVCSEIYTKFKTNISSEYWNFEVNIVDKVSPGDFGDVLLKNFEGVVAVKYY